MHVAALIALVAGIILSRINIDFAYIVMFNIKTAFLNYNVFKNVNKIGEFLVTFITFAFALQRHYKEAIITEELEIIGLLINNILRQN